MPSAGFQQHIKGTTFEIEKFACSNTLIFKCYFLGQCTIVNKFRVINRILSRFDQKSCNVG
jgi:hypothetical protein